MLAGEAACQDAARLRHIERIECPQHGDVQEMVAAFGNLRAYAVFFIAEDEQGGGMQAGGEGVEAAFAERGPVDEESRVPCLVQRPGDVHNLGDRKAFQRSGCGAARPGPQKGAVVAGYDQPGPAHRVQRAGEGSGVAGVLHLIKHKDERQGSVRSVREQIGELGETGLEKPGDDALMPGGAKPIEALGVRKRKTDFGGTAQVEDAIRILRTFALADKNGVDAFRSRSSKTGLTPERTACSSLESEQEAFSRDASCSTAFGAERNALRGEVFFSVIMRSLKVVTSRRIAKLGLVE